MIHVLPCHRKGPNMIALNIKMYIIFYPPHHHQSSQPYFHHDEFKAVPRGAWSAMAPPK